MFRATIRRPEPHEPIVLGPTDTRDEAARLARAWMQGRDPAVPVLGVPIERIEGQGQALDALFADIGGSAAGGAKEGCDFCCDVAFSLEAYETRVRG